MDGWNTILSYLGGAFSGALAVSFREGTNLGPGPLHVQLRHGWGNFFILKEDDLGIRLGTTLSLVVPCKLTPWHEKEPDNKVYIYVSIYLFICFYVYSSVYLFIPSFIINLCISLSIYFSIYSSMY